MKKFFGLFFVLALILTACKNVPTPTSIDPADQEWIMVPDSVSSYNLSVPWEKLELWDLFDKYGRDDHLNTITFVQEPYNEMNNSIRVIFNGIPVELVDHADSSTIEMTYCGLSVSGTRCQWWSSFKNGFDSERYANTFLVFPHYWSGRNLVIISLDDMPRIVNPAKWNGTFAELAVWELPLGVKVVENLDTNEMAIDIDMYKHYGPNGRTNMMASGDILWGYIYFEENSVLAEHPIILNTGEMPTDFYENPVELRHALHISPTEISQTRMNSVASIAEDIWPNLSLGGPIDVCMYLSTWEPKTKAEETAMQRMIRNCGDLYISRD